MKEKVIVSTSTLFVSLLTYLYAKHCGKDVIPYMMIGGFFGGVLGEVIVHLGKDDDDNTPGTTPAKVSMS